MSAFVCIPDSGRRSCEVEKAIKDIAGRSPPCLGHSRNHMCLYFSSDLAASVPI